MPLSLAGDPAHCYRFPLQGQRWRPNQMRLTPLEQSGRNIGTKGHREPGWKWRNLLGFIVLLSFTLFILCYWFKSVRARAGRAAREEAVSLGSDNVTRHPRRNVALMNGFICISIKESAGRKWIERGWDPSEIVGAWLDEPSAYHLQSRLFISFVSSHLECEFQIGAQGNTLHRTPSFIFIKSKSKTTTKMFIPLLLLWS